MEITSCNSGDSNGSNLPRFFFILISGTVLLSAIVTPLVFSTIRLLCGEDPWPFSRVYDRVALGVALLIVIRYRNALPREQIKTFLKSASLKHASTLIIIGLLITLTTALAGLPNLVNNGQFIWNTRSSLDYLLRFAHLLPVAIFISLLEEFFFRVIVFLSLCKHFHWTIAASMSSLLYSIVHFVQPLKSYQPDHSIFVVGFDYTLTILTRLFSVSLLPALFGLFLTGFVLCTIFRSTKSFYLCVGLHAGWIMAMKMALFATIETERLALAVGASRRYFLAAQINGWTSIVVAFLIIMALNKVKIFKTSQEESTKKRRSVT